MTDRQTNRQTDRDVHALHSEGQFTCSAHLIAASTAYFIN